MNMAVLVRAYQVVTPVGTCHMLAHVGTCHLLLYYQVMITWSV